MLLEIRYSNNFAIMNIMTNLLFTSILFGVQTGNTLHQRTVLTDYKLLHNFPQVDLKTWIGSTWWCRQQLVRAWKPIRWLILGYMSRFSRYLCLWVNLRIEVITSSGRAAVKYNNIMWCVVTIRCQFEKLGDRIFLNKSKWLWILEVLNK